MKGPLRPEEQSEKAEDCQENLWNEILLKGPSRQRQTQEQNKKGVGKLTEVTLIVILIKEKQT